MARRIILAPEHTALYDGLLLERQGGPTRLSPETLVNLFPDAEVYIMTQAQYDQLIDGRGFPPQLAGLPLDKLEKSTRVDAVVDKVGKAIERLKAELTVQELADLVARLR